MISYGVSQFIMHFVAFIILVLVFYLAFRKKGFLSTNEIEYLTGQEKKNIRKIIAFLGLFVYILGLVFIFFLKEQKENEIRQRLLSGAQAVAEGLNYRIISTLEFSEADLNNPNYYRLNRQFQKASSVLGNRDVYTMVLKDSQIVFGPESIAPELFHASLPGDIYQIPPQGLKEVFTNGNYLIAGPYEDEFGKFVSAFYPVFRQHSPEPFMVVGMDIHEHDWKDKVYLVTIVPHVLIILLLLLLFLGNFLFSRPRIMKIERVIWWQSPEAMFAFIGSVIISLIIIFISVRVEQRYRKDIFKQSSSIQANQFRSYMRTFEWHLWRTSEAIGRLPELSNEQFLLEVDFLNQLDFIEAIGWAEKVQMNHLIRQIEPENYEVFETGSVFPEFSAETTKFLEKTVSQRLLSTEEISLNSDSNSGKLIIYVPVHIENAALHHGTIFMIVNVDKLLARSVALRGAENNLFNVVFDLVEPEKNVSTIGVFGDEFFLDKKKSEITTYYFLFMFGRSWRLEFYPGHFFNQTHPSIALPVSLSIAIILTLLLTLIVGLLSTRKFRLQEEVEKRTRDLNQSERRFFLLFSSMTEGVGLHRVIRDQNGKIINYLLLDINPAFSRILGIPRKEVIGRVATDLYQQPEAPFLNIYSRVVEDGTATRFEEYFLPMDRYFDVSAVPMSDDTFATIFTDITHRVITERTIRESEEKYRMISENVGDVIWVMDVSTYSFRYMSPSMERISGYTVEEALNLKLRDLLTHESLSFVNVSLPERILQFEQGDESLHTRTVTLEQIKKDGSILNTEVTTTLITNDSGKVKEVLGVTRDVTEMVVARKALSKSEENYRFLVENQSDFIIKVDLQGRYLYASPSFCKAVGKTEQELINQIFIPPIDSKSAVSSLEALEKLQKPPFRVRFEQKIKLDSGWIWISWNNSSVLQDGEPVGYIGVGRDVTREKEYEIELEKSRNKLQVQNEEYAMLNEEYHSINEELQCTNEELVQAIDRAQESENLKTAFLQNMSHEIRTPLNAIIGFSEMLTLPGFDENEKVNFSEIVVNSSRELLNLVNDILTISTLETRQEKMIVQRIKVKEMMQELNTVFSNNASKKGLNLRFAVYDNLPDDFTIAADELKLKQVFNNLIGNAIKFTEKGEVVFGLDSVDAKAENVHFFVSDTGIGISSEAQEKVFERFRQADPEVQSRYGGTGLGLAICKGHIELMGGKIWVESEPGKGSTFHFVLPLG